MRRRLMMLLAGCVTAGTVATGLAQAGPGTDRDALARELRGAWLPLESGMTMSRSEGTPISAKYEIDNGTFQLSVYTASGDHLSPRRSASSCRLSCSCSSWRRFSSATARTRTCKAS